MAMQGLCHQQSRQRRKKSKKQFSLEPRAHVSQGYHEICSFPLPCLSISFRHLQSGHSVHRNNPAVFSIINNAVLQRVVPLLLLKSEGKNATQSGRYCWSKRRCLALCYIKSEKMMAQQQTPWHAEWDYKPGPALCMKKLQADCQDPSLNTFQSGLLWGVWALWSQLPTSTSAGSSLQAGTHSPNNPGFDPYSCCAVNLSGISAGERGHMDSPWDRNLIYPQKFPCGQQHRKIHLTWYVPKPRALLSSSLNN